jgi:hypothetical protein
MPARKRKNAFGDIFRSRVTYHRDVAKERRQLQSQAFADRKMRLRLKKLEAQERTAAAKIAAADRKIAAAEAKISAAASKGRGGSMSEAQFEATRAKLQREIEKQEKDKSLARALFDEVREYGKNPSWGFGIYQGRGYETRQVAHFRSKAAAETYARSAGLKGYSIKRAFDKGESNPATSGSQYRLAQAVLSGTARQTHMSPEAAREIIDRTPARLRSEYSRRNPAMEFSTEYHLGYNLGQADRQSALLRKTLDELHATFAANFAPGSLASWESFEQAYQAGYGGQMGAAAPNPEMPTDKVKVHPHRGKWGVFVGGYHRATKATQRGAEAYAQRIRDANPTRRNPAADDDGTEEYEQSKRIAELFHGRPVKEEITVTENIREHDWLWRIGPLVKLKIRTLTKRNAALPFHQTEEGMVHLFCSPDGRQFYLRGGDQELDLKALGMGEGTEWYRDHMLIGEAKEITYRDKKKFHKFKLTDYFHKLGEVTKKKPMLGYNALAHKMEIVGGQYKVETEDLVDGMSPGIVN